MRPFVFFLLSSLQWMIPQTEGKASTVTCLKSEECILPCQFQSDGKGARVMWFKKKAVVSCTRYGNTSFVVGHNSPADKYKGRTDLYGDLVLEGNATLLLRNVTPHDEGKYYCITYTATSANESGIITLVVKAPVHEVLIGFSDNAIICRAAGGYPAPTIAWSTHPPTVDKQLQVKTMSQQNYLGFFNTDSSLRMTENSTNQTYICRVTSEINEKTAYLKQEVSLQASPGSSLKIPCTLPHSIPQSFNLSWTFKYLDPILTIRHNGLRSNVTIWQSWRPYVFKGHSPSHSLTLQSLTVEHSGVYTCEIQTPDDKYITQIEVLVTADSTWQFYVVILVLCCLLIISYCVMGVLSCKIRRLTEIRRQNSTESKTPFIHKS